MDREQGAAQGQARSWRPGPLVKLLALVLAALLLVLVGIRLYAWTDQSREARVLVLVNTWNDVDKSGFSPQLRTVEDGLQVDNSCRKDLERMLEECREAGFHPRLTAAYRSREQQQELFDRQIQALLPQFQGDRSAAEAEAARLVARPGTSEHELGLAVHIESDDGQEQAMRRWLGENSWRFGFILRYPQGAESITGMLGDPAHFRYVGLAAAGQIYTLNITLEEYTQMFFSESAQVIFE